MILRASTRLLLHPVVLLALLAWALNDHVLKATFPGWTTGKFSDLSSMIAAPVLGFAWVELLIPRFTFQHRKIVMAGSALACAASLALINLSALAADLYRAGLGVLQWPFWALVSSTPTGPPLEARVAYVADPTDALVAPTAIVPVLLAARAWRG